MIGRAELAEACRRNDAQLAAGNVLDEVLRDLDVDPRAAAFVAERRAIRHALLFEGWTEIELNALGDHVRSSRLRIDPATQFFVPTFAACFFDGMAALKRAETVLNDRVKVPLVPAN